MYLLNPVSLKCTRLWHVLVFWISQVRVASYSPIKWSKLNVKFWQMILVIGSFTPKMSALALKSCQSNPSAYKCQHTHTQVLTWGKATRLLSLPFFRIGPTSLLLVFSQLWARFPFSVCTPAELEDSNFCWVKLKHKSSFVSEINRCQRSLFCAWGWCCEEEEGLQHQEWNHCTVVTLRQISWTSVFMPFVFCFVPVM